VRIVVPHLAVASALAPRPDARAPRLTSEECMAEAAFCLDQAGHSDGERTKALCLGLAALWHELAATIARLEARGTA
jgi:hypothetical protein